MSISPPSDIVFDVLRASDPQRQQIAAQKLATAAGSSMQKQQIVIRPTSAMPTRPSFDADLAMAQRNNQQILSRAPTTSSNSPVGSAHRQFETMVLKDFVQRMLPEKSEATFGQGTAGSIWKSWMADAVAKEISDAGGIGLTGVLQPASFAPKVAAPSADLDAANAVTRATNFDAATSNLAETVPPAVSASASPPSGLSGFISKLQEMFLDIFSGEQTGKRNASRPTFDV